jgi:hypothetical protein
MDATLNQRFRARLGYELDLRIPSFTRTVPPGSVLQRTLANRDTELWYVEFRDKLLSRIRKAHFPVFRFSDGECFFVAGYRPPPAPLGMPKVNYYAKLFLSAYVKHRLQWKFRSGTPLNSYEQYTRAEWRRARASFVEYLREIAQVGILAFNFVMQFGVPLCDQYLDAVCEWFDRESIPVTQQNFVPFYFVYAMLLGPDRRLFFEGKKLLLATHITPQRETALRESLKREGAQSVSFIRISPSKAMLDTITLGDDQLCVDLALIGGGVGAANILHQLRPIQTVCIDAGYALDCLASPSLRGSRLFTKPDDWMDGQVD